LQYCKSGPFEDYQYDQSGNLTRDARGQQFAYNAENLQITATGSGLSQVYGYDGNNKRVTSYDAVNDRTTIFVYDANGALAAEYTVNVEPPDVPVISYLTEDALGSVRVTTNSFGEVKARRDFLPFGEELYAGLAGRNANQKYSASADDTRKKFATYQRDIETGLDFAQSRYYSPMHGRFTSPDEFKGGPDELFDFEEDASDNPTFYADLTNPQSLNKYQYGYNNPYKYNDPSGHCPPVSSCLDKAQEVGDWFGLIPKIGDAVDAVNAGVSLARGDYEGAGRRAIAIIPVVGTPISFAMKGAKAAKASKAVVKKSDDAVTTGAKKITPTKAENLSMAEQKKIPPSQLGPSGKPKIHTKKMATDKRAKDYARNRGQGPPVKHNNPRNGRSHWHPTDRKGNKKAGKDNLHVESLKKQRGELQ
jgi:RHS repeat-associated protein